MLRLLVLSYTALMLCNEMHAPRSDLTVRQLASLANVLYGRDSGVVTTPDAKICHQQGFTVHKPPTAVCHLLQITTLLLSLSIQNPSLLAQLELLV